MRLKGLPWVLSLAVVGVLSSAAVASPTPPLTSPVDRQKVEEAVDESDPRIIEARRIQGLEDDLSALVESSPGTYTAVIAVAPGKYHLLVKAGTDRATAERQVAALVDKHRRPADSAAVATAKRSRSELMDLHAQVDALLDEMLAAGAQIAGTGPDFTRGKVHIDIESGQAAAERVLGPLVDDVHFVPSVPTNNGASAKLVDGQGALAVLRCRASR